MEERDARIEDHYEDLAPLWDDIVDAPGRQELLWATVDELLPELSGRRVLDAGCGSGVYAERLADQGADVVGVDVSEGMVERARERVPSGAFYQADLGEPLDAVEDDSVDLVVCLHVFSHLPDLSTTVGEFARILRDGGHLVLSTHNPVHDFVIVRDGETPSTGATADLEATVETQAEAPTYGTTERYDITWSDGTGTNRGTYFRRSFEGLLSPLLSAGFDLDAVREPVPDEEFRRDHPDLAARYADLPASSLCLRASR